MKKLIKHGTWSLGLFLFFWSCLVLGFPWQELGERISYHLWQHYKLAVRVEKVHYTLPLGIQAQIRLLSSSPKLRFLPESGQCQITLNPLKIFLGTLELETLLTGQADLADSQQGKNRGTGKQQLKIIVKNDLLTDSLTLVIATPTPWKRQKIPLTIAGGYRAVLDGQITLRARLHPKISQNGLDLPGTTGEGSLDLQQGTLHFTSPQLPVPDLSAVQARIIWQLQDAVLRFSPVNIKSKGASLNLKGIIRLPKTALGHDFYSRCLISAQGTFQYTTGCPLYSLLKGIWNRKTVHFQLTGPLNRPKFIL